MLGTDLTQKKEYILIPSMSKLLLLSVDKSLVSVDSIEEDLNSVV